MRSPRVLRSLGVLAIAALTLSACGGGDDDETSAGGQTGGDQRTYSVAFVGPLTGDNANLGINIRNGARVAVDEANRRGGPRIELKEFDTQGDPAQATTLKERFINDQSIIGIVGPTFSGETRAVMQSLQEAGLVMVSASATNAALPTAVPNQTVFHRLVPDDDVQGKGVADYVTKKLQAKTVAYVHDNSDYGKGLAEGTQKILEGAGTRTALVDAVDPKAQDFSAAVNKVRGANADVIFYGGYYAEAGRFKKQLTDAGVRATFVSGDGSLDARFIENAGAAAAEGSRLTCPCNLALESSTGSLKTFYDNFRRTIGTEPGLYSPEAYDAAKILIQGIKAGNTDRAKLLQYVEGFGRLDGISKPVEFEPNGNLRSKSFFVFEIKGGKIAPSQQIEVT